MQRRTSTAIVGLMVSLVIAIGPGLSAGQIAPRPHTPGLRREMRRDRAEEHLEKMSQELNLSREQKEQIRPILRREFKQLRTLHRNVSLPPDERRAQASEIRKSSRSEIDQILTPEQRAQWKEIRKREHERKPVQEGMPPSEE